MCTVLYKPPDPVYEDVKNKAYHANQLARKTVYSIPSRTKSHHSPMRTTFYRSPVRTTANISPVRTTANSSPTRIGAVRMTNNISPVTKIATTTSPIRTTWAEMSKSIKLKY